MVKRHLPVEWHPAGQLFRTGQDISMKNPQDETAAHRCDSTGKLLCT